MKHVTMHRLTLKYPAHWLTLLALAAWLAACGGGGGSGSDTPAAVADCASSKQGSGWISVTDPDSCPSSTESEVLYVLGEAFISPTWSHCCSGSATDTGVTVTWRNETTGTGGEASQFVRYCWLFAVFLCDHSWLDNIPLALGNNRISITASDPSGNSGNAIITATRVPETVVPTVLGTTPANLATDVSPNQGIVAVFSEQLDPATVNNTTFTLADTRGNPVNGTVGYANNSATFTPTGVLDYSTGYLATLSSDIADLSGNRLAQDFSWQFTTGAQPDTTPPAITLVDPADGTSCVPLDTRLTATFSEPMDSTTLNTRTFLLTDLSSNPVSGRLSGSDTTSTFIPYSYLAYGTGYRATITTGATDLSANPLPADYSWTFQTVPDGSGQWQPTTDSNAPGARYGHSAIWSGNEMIVWGGGWNDGTSTGGRYNPVTDSWQATATSGAPTGRIHHSAVWTGTEMIVWGGYTPFQIWNDDGGRYDPVTDSWQGITTSGAPAARRYHAAVWTGSEMIIWGGAGASGYFTDGARYNPATDSWQPMASHSLGFDTGSAAFWTGSEMIILTGNRGARYNPATDSWQDLADQGAPLNFAAAVWTGTEILVRGTSYFGAYDPLTDNWRQLTQACAPPYRELTTAVWSGDAMIIWGGRYGLSALDTGGYYSTALDLWQATSRTAAPPPRYYHSAVWTGSEMIVWGGVPFTASSTGGRFTPQ